MELSLIHGRRGLEWAVIFFLPLLIVLSCSHSAFIPQGQQSGFNLYFVRHAETVANATGKQTPENVNTFTEKGLMEIDSLTEALLKLPIDNVIVSPTYRTEHTVLPFLKQRGIQAEVWPELEEWLMEADPMTMKMMGDERSIRINPQDDAYFRLRDMRANMHLIAKDYAGGLAQTREAARLINERFSQSGKSVLIVGHSNAGSRLLEVLMGLEPTVRFKLEKGKITMLHQDSDGKYEMVMLNGKPCSG